MTPVAGTWNGGTVKTRSGAPSGHSGGVASGTSSGSGPSPRGAPASIQRTRSRFSVPVSERSKAKCPISGSASCGGMRPLSTVSFDIAAQRWAMAIARERERPGALRTMAGDAFLAHHRRHARGVVVGGERHLWRRAVSSGTRASRPPARRPRVRPAAPRSRRRGSASWPAASAIRSRTGRRARPGTRRGGAGCR